MQARTVNVGPVTAAVTNQVAASQTPDAGQIVINGAGATFSINNIAASQDPAGAGNLTLAAPYIVFDVARYVYITSAGDDSLLTFTVTGWDVNNSPAVESITGGNTKAVVSTKKFKAVTNVAVSGDSGSVQVGSFEGATFTGSTARQVTIVATGNESAKTFVVTGTDINGSSITESVAGPNATTATTTAYFKTVNSITISAGAAGALTVGMTNTASSAWARFDDFAPSPASLQCSVDGSATYTVQSSLDDPYDAIAPVSAAAMVWVNSSDAAVVAATGTKQSSFTAIPKYARVLLTTTSTGSVSSTFLQASNGPK